MRVAPDASLWWDTKRPNQDALFVSWVELGEQFYQSLITKPVPLDLRALKVLKRSPLALDVYAWVCYQAFRIIKYGTQGEFFTWYQLARTMGAEYDDIHDFQKKVSKALRKVESVYLGLTIRFSTGGFSIFASRLAVPEAPVQKVGG